MLTFEHVSKTYATGAQALDDICLGVEEAEIVAVIGASGCGKSTLLRLGAGLDRASGGRIRVDGDEVAAPHPAIGIVFQEPRLSPGSRRAECRILHRPPAPPRPRGARGGRARRGRPCGPRQSLAA